MSVKYLTALAFYSQPGAVPNPTELQLEEFAQVLSRRYDDLIRAALGNPQLGLQTLAYVSALAAMTSARTAATQVRAACQFFQFVSPLLPGDNFLGIAAREAMVTPVSTRTRKTTTKAKSTGRKRAKATGKVAQGSKRLPKGKGSR